MTHKMKLNNEPFMNIKNGTKIIELRLNDEKRQLLKINDLIEFINNDTREQMIVKVLDLHHYPSFEELYKHFDKVSMGYKEDEEANPKDMEKYYSKEEQDKYGVLGIEIERSDKMNLLDHKELINDRPTHIATVTKDNKPNLAVASNIRVLDDNRLIISASEMNNTQNNIKSNENVVLTVFDDKWVGLRIFGKAKFYESGEYYDYCHKEFFPEGKVTPFGITKPKGAIVVTVEKIEEYK